MRKVEKDELCSSCLKVRPILNDESLGPSIEEWLDSKGYNNGNPASLLMMNLSAYTYLKMNGGCSKCINLFEQLLRDAGFEDEYLAELGKK